MSADRKPVPLHAKPVSRAEQKLRAFHEEGAIGKAYDARLVRRLWPYVKPHGRYIAYSLGTLVVMAGVNLLRPILMGDVVRSATESDAARLMRDGFGLAVLLVLLQSMTFVQMYMMQMAGARAMADLRAEIFLFMQRLELSYFDRTPVGRLVTRATNDVDAVGELFASGVLNAVGDLLSLTGIVVMMLVLDFRLSLISFAGAALVGIIVNFVRKRSREAYRDIRTKTARLNAFLNEQVSGIAVVQAYAREAAMADEFDLINESYREANKRSIFYEALLDAAIEMVGTLCIASVLFWTGFHRLGAHVVTFATVVTFTQYIKQFFEPVSMLSTRYTVLQSAMAGAERIFQLLDVKQVDAPPLDASACCADGPADEAIALENVTFEYKPGVPVLVDVSLVAKRGEKVALVGATGAGKTTIGEPAAATLRGDVGERARPGQGRPELRPPRAARAVLGRAAGRVPLRGDGAVERGHERPFAGPGARRAALRQHRRARAVPASRGAGSTPGRRAWVELQRGRAAAPGVRAGPLPRRADLILDEATASVDSDTEARLQRALEAVMEGRTALVIAHRLSTIRAADRIVVFHKGHVVETGSHDELIAKGACTRGSTGCSSRRRSRSRTRRRQTARPDARRDVACTLAVPGAHGAASGLPNALDVTRRAARVITWMNLA